MVDESGVNSGECDGDIVEVLGEGENCSVLSPDWEGNRIVRSSKNSGRGTGRSIVA